MSLLSVQVNYLGKTDQENLKERKHFLEEVLSNTFLEDGTRIRAIHSLSSIGDTKSRKILYERLEKEENPWVKRELKRVLSFLETGERLRPTLGIIFDIDGTLIDKSKTKMPVHKAVLEAVGIKVTRADINLMKTIKKEAGGNKKILRAVLERYNRKEKLKEALKIRDEIKFKVYKTFTEEDLPLMRGAQELLDHLQEKRKKGEVRIATAGTGGKEIVDHDFKVHGLHKYFDVIVTLGTKEGLRERPHADIFVEAQQLLEKNFAVERENVIIIDDRPESGLKSLSPVIAITSSREKIKIYEDRAHHVIYDLGELNLDKFHKILKDHWERVNLMGETKWRAQLSQMLHGRKLTEEEEKSAYQVRIHFDTPPLGTLQWMKVPVTREDLESAEKLKNLKEELAKEGERFLVPKVYALAVSGNKILFLKKENKWEFPNDYILYNKNRYQTLKDLLEEKKIKFKDIKPLPFLGGEKDPSLQFVFRISIDEKNHPPDAKWLEEEEIKKVESRLPITQESLEIAKEYCQSQN